MCLKPYVCLCVQGNATRGAAVAGCSARGGPAAAKCPGRNIGPDAQSRCIIAGLSDPFQDSSENATYRMHTCALWALHHQIETAPGVE